MTIFPELPIAPEAEACGRFLQEALEIFERLGDRRGAMSTIIAMGYLNWAPDIHLGSGAGRHIEEIRRLTSSMSALTNASGRAAAEAQMLYGVHVFARAKVIPDLAVSRGEEAFRAATEIGDPALSFLAAGGSAMANLDIEELDAADAWLDRAAAVASDNPTPLRARRMAAGAAPLPQRVAMPPGCANTSSARPSSPPTTDGPAARCEALSDLAREAAKLGLAQHDPELLRLAERRGDRGARARARPHRPPALGGAGRRRARDRGARPRRCASKRRRSRVRRSAASTRPTRRIPVCRSCSPRHASSATIGATEIEDVLGLVGYIAAMIAQRTIDESIRVRWFRGPTGRALTELVGEGEMAGTDSDDAPKDADQALLQGLVRGQTDAEIAAALGIDEDEVVRRLGGLFAKIGASSRAEATAFAFRERVL